MLPAVGQGEERGSRPGDDTATRESSGLPRSRADPPAVKAERAMLAALHGGCMAPIAGWGRIEDGQLVLTGRVLNLLGTQKIEATLAGTETYLKPSAETWRACCSTRGGPSPWPECRE